MDYLTQFVDKITQYNAIELNRQFLVSGTDSRIRKVVLEGVLHQCRQNEESLIIIDDTGFAHLENIDTINAFGYQIQNALSGEYCLYNPFKINNVKGMSKFRQLLGTIEYTEKSKAKLISYLNFIQYIEYLYYGERETELSLNTLQDYCTTMAVENKILDLLKARIINEHDQMTLLAKYAECASAAADFENDLSLIRSFITGKDMNAALRTNQAIVLPLADYGIDETLRNLVLQLLQFGIEEIGNPITIIIFDKGYGARTYISNLFNRLPPHVNIHLFSEDIFTLTDTDSRAMLFNRFNVRVYSRHLAMNSAEEIEKACGEIDVPKKSQTISYDRRWKNKSFLDVLMGTDQMETYTKLPSVREPRYHKEEIVSFPPGRGIVECMGNTSIFGI